MHQLFEMVIAVVLIMRPPFAITSPCNFDSLSSLPLATLMPIDEKAPLVYNLVCGQPDWQACSIFMIPCGWIPAIASEYLLSNAQWVAGSQPIHLTFTTPTHWKIKNRWRAFGIPVALTL